MSGDTEFSRDFYDILNGGSEGLNRFKKTNAALPSKTGRIGENNYVFTMKTLNSLQPKSNVTCLHGTLAALNG